MPLIDLGPIKSDLIDLGSSKPNLIDLGPQVAPQPPQAVTPTITQPGAVRPLARPTTPSTATLPPSGEGVTPLGGQIYFDSPGVADPDDIAPGVNVPGDPRTAIIPQPSSEMMEFARRAMSGEEIPQTPGPDVKLGITEIDQDYKPPWLLSMIAGGEEGAMAIQKANLFRHDPELAKQTFPNDETINFFTDNPEQSFVPQMFNPRLDDWRMEEVSNLAGMTRVERKKFNEAKGKIATGEHFKRKDNREYMVFSGTLKYLKSKEFKESIDRLREDNYNFDKDNYNPQKANDQLVIRDKLLLLEEMQDRGMTLPATILDSIANMAKYAGEIYLLAGLGGVGFRATTQIGKLGVAAKLAAVNVGEVMALTAERMTDKGVIGDKGEFIRTEKGQVLAKALPKSFVEQTVTYWTEQQGEIITKGLNKIGGKALKKLPKGVATFIAKHGKFPDWFTAVMKQGKYDGIIGELFEEYIDKIIKPTLLLDDQYRNKDDEYVTRVAKSFVPDPKEVFVQTVTFAVVPLGGHIAKGVTVADQRLKEQLAGFEAETTQPVAPTVTAETKPTIEELKKVSGPVLAELEAEAEAIAELKKVSGPVLEQLQAEAEAAGAGPPAETEGKVNETRRLANLTDAGGYMPVGYTQAKKQAGDRGWKLFYIGTKNEVFPGELFKSAQEAKRTFEAVTSFKRTEQPPPSAEAEAAEGKVEGRANKITTRLEEMNNERIALYESGKEVSKEFRTEQRGLKKEIIELNPLNQIANTLKKGDRIISDDDIFTVDSVSSFGNKGDVLVSGTWENGVNAAFQGSSMQHTFFSETEATSISTGKRVKVPAATVERAPAPPAKAVTEEGIIPTEAGEAPVTEPATVKQKARAHIMQKEQGMSDLDFGKLAGKSMKDMTKQEASAFIDRLKVEKRPVIQPITKRVINFTVPELSQIKRSAQSKEVLDAVTDYAENLGPAPKDPTLRKSYIQDLRAVALTKRRLKTKGIDSGFSKDEVDLINELSSARYALGQAEVKSGVPLRKQYSTIVGNANEARIESDDIIRGVLKEAGVGKFSTALSRTENNNMANWLFEENPVKKADFWEMLSPNAKAIAEGMHGILQGRGALEVREARWRLWDTAERQASAKIKDLEVQLQVLADKKSTPANQKKIKFMQDEIVSIRHGVDKIQPRNAPASALESGREANNKGQLKEWIATQQWGTRQSYYMSDESLDDLIDMASSMDIATTIEEKATTGKPSIFLREAQTRTGAARVKGGSVVNATIAHLERLMTFNVTYDDIQGMWTSLQGEKITKRDMGVLKDFVDTAVGKRKKAGAYTRIAQKATRLFWRFHFANPLKSAWFVTRNLLQNIAYAPSQMSMVEWAKSTPLVYIKKIVGKKNPEMATAFEKEWKPKISQKRQMYRQFMLQDEGDISRKLTHRAAILMDLVGGAATMSDEINRISVWPVLYTAAQNNAKSYKAGSMSLGRLSNRLRLETLHVTQRMELKQLLETNPAGFAARFAEYKVENIHFKYETAFRAAAEQGTLQRIVGGLTVYPRGFLELAYQNSVKPFYQGMQTGNHRMAWQGLVGLMMLLIGTEAAKRLVEKITGKSAYGILGNLFQYGPGGPGLGKLQDFFDHLQNMKYTIEGLDDDAPISDTLVKGLMKIGGELGELFIPVCTAYINHYENSENVYGVRLWSLVKKEFIDKYGGAYVHGRKFRETDRTFMEKIQHQIYGGAEEGEETSIPHYKKIGR